MGSSILSSQPETSKTICKQMSYYLIIDVQMSLARAPSWCECGVFADLPEKIEWWFITQNYFVMIFA